MQHPQYAVVVQRAETDRRLLTAFIQPMLSITVYVDGLQREAVAFSAVRQPRSPCTLHQLRLARSSTGIKFSLSLQALSLHDHIVSIAALVGRVGAGLARAHRVGAKHEAEPRTRSQCRGERLRGNLPCWVRCHRLSVRQDVKSGPMAKLLAPEEKVARACVCVAHQSPDHLMVAVRVFWNRAGELSQGLATAEFNLAQVSHQPGPPTQWCSSRGANWCRRRDLGWS